MSKSVLILLLCLAFTQGGFLDGDDQFHDSVESIDDLIQENLDESDFEEVSITPQKAVEEEEDDTIDPSDYSAYDSDDEIEAELDVEMERHTLLSAGDTGGVSTFNSSTAETHKSVKRMLAFVRERLNLDRAVCGKTKPFTRIVANKIERQASHDLLYWTEVTLKRHGVPDETYQLQVEYLARDDLRENPLTVCPYKRQKNVERWCANLGKKMPFMINDVRPNPCKYKALANSFASIKRNNGFNRPWKSSSYQFFRGKTLEELATTKLGFVPLKKNLPSTISIEDLNAAQNVATCGNIPDSYDSRDDLKGCIAHQNILDQGDCGSCYAQAAATVYSLRLCKMTQYKVNIDVSAQDMMDCTSQCSGGEAQAVWEKMKTTPMYESNCKPYVGAAKTCGGSACATGCRWYVDQTAFVPMSGKNSRQKVEAIQQEILLRGPVWVGFDIYEDFFEYKSGVYTKSSNTQAGGHAVTLIGWGTQGGIDYWLAQNSWGGKWGEGGYFKIRRGTNECGIEEYDPLAVIPKLTSTCNCGGKQCCNGASLDKSCNCKCNNKFSGATCSECNVSQGATVCNGGSLKADTCTCTCPIGRVGESCELVEDVTNNVFAKGSTAPVQFAWKGKYPTGTFIQVWTANTIVPDSPKNPKGAKQVGEAFLCGDQTKWSTSNQFCPQSGSATISGSSSWPVGDYKVFIFYFLGLNEFGVSRQYAVPDAAALVPIRVVASADLVAGAKATLAAVQAVTAEDPNRIRRLKAAQQYLTCSENGWDSLSNAATAGVCAPSATPTQAPTQPPTTKAPTTAAPTTKAPTTAAPTTKAPTTAAPTTTKAPTTKAPTTPAPTTTAAPTQDPKKIAEEKAKQEAAKKAADEAAKKATADEAKKKADAAAKDAAEKLAKQKAAEEAKKAADAKKKADEEAAKKKADEDKLQKAKDQKDMDEKVRLEEKLRKDEELKKKAEQEKKAADEKLQKAKKAAEDQKKAQDEAQKEAAQAAADAAKALLLDAVEQAGGWLRFCKDPSNALRAPKQCQLANELRLLKSQVKEAGGWLKWCGVKQNFDLRPKICKRVQARAALKQQIQAAGGFKKFCATATDAKVLKVCKHHLARRALEKRVEQFGGWYKFCTESDDADDFKKKCKRVKATHARNKAVRAAGGWVKFCQIERNAKKNPVTCKKVLARNEKRLARIRADKAARDAGGWFQFCQAKDIRKLHKARCAKALRVEKLRKRNAANKKAREAAKRKQREERTRVLQKRREALRKAVKAAGGWSKFCADDTNKKTYTKKCGKVLRRDAERAERLKARKALIRALLQKVKAAGGWSKYCATNPDTALDKRICARVAKRDAQRAARLEDNAKLAATVKAAGGWGKFCAIDQNQKRHKSTCARIKARKLLREARRQERKALRAAVKAAGGWVKYCLNDANRGKNQHRCERVIKRYEEQQKRRAAAKAARVALQKSVKAAGGWVNYCEAQNGDYKNNKSVQRTCERVLRQKALMTERRAKRLALRNAVQAAGGWVKFCEIKELDAEYKDRCSVVLSRHRAQVALRQAIKDAGGIAAFCSEIEHKDTRVCRVYLQSNGAKEEEDVYEDAASELEDSEAEAMEEEHRDADEHEESELEEVLDLDFEEDAHEESTEEDAKDDVDTEYEDIEMEDLDAFEEETDDQDE